MYVKNAFPTLKYLCHEKIANNNKMLLKVSRHLLKKYLFFTKIICYSVKMFL